MSQTQPIPSNNLAHALTLDEMKEALPPHLKSAASQDLCDTFNQMTTDPEFAEHLKENFISYTGVLRDGKFKTQDYINAVTYVSHKLMGKTNSEAYKATFPNRYAALKLRQATDKEISSYVSIYNKTKLVNKILEQTLIPAWVYNQEIFQKAINTQAELMMHAKSEKVRSDAANSILTHLKKPEAHKVELDIGLKENSGMAELNEMLASLAERQQELIGQGVPTRTIAHQKINGTLSDPDISAMKDVTPHHTAPEQGAAGEKDETK